MQGVVCGQRGVCIGVRARSTLSNVFWVSNRSPAGAAGPFDPTERFLGLKSIPGQGYQPVRPRV